MNVDPGWVACGLVFVVSVGGWGITAIRNGRSQATKFGNLEGKVAGIVDGLGTRMSSIEKSVDSRMDSVETSINNLSGRIDNLVDGFDGRGRRSKKP